MKKLLMLGLAILFVGCNSVTTVYEYDNTGKIVQKKIITDESVIKSIMKEMENKNVAWGTNGWVLQLEATFVSQDTYMPTIKMRAANGNHWHISFLEDIDPQPSIESIMHVGLDVDTKTVKVGNKK